MHHLSFNLSLKMKKLTLSILFGLGLVSQIHDLTAEDSKTLDFKYLVLSETVIEDMAAFESLQKGWSTWLNDNNIKTKKILVNVDVHKCKYVSLVIRNLSYYKFNHLY